MEAGHAQPPAFQEVGDARFCLTGPIAGLEVADGGRTIVVAADHKLTFFDIDEGRELRVLEHSNVSAIAVTAHGDRLFSAGYPPRSRDVRSWKLDGFEPGPAFAVAGHVGSLVCGPNDVLLLGVAKKVRLVSGSTGDDIRPLKGHLSDVKAVAISRDGKWAASAGGDGKVKIHDLTNGKVRCTLTASASSLQFSGDGRVLLSAGYAHVCLWDSLSGERVRSYAIDGANVAVFDATERAVAIGTGRGDVVVVDAETGERRGEHRFPADAYVTHLRFAPGGHRLIAGVCWRSTSAIVCVLDVQTVRPIAPTAAPRGAVVGICPRGTSGAILICTTDGTVSTRNPSHSEPSATFSTGQALNLIGVSPDGRWGLTTIFEGEGRAQLWDLESGIGARAIELGHRRAGAGVISSDGTRAALRYGSRLAIFALPELVELAEIDVEHYIGALAFQSTSRLMTGTHPGRRDHGDIACWDLATLERTASVAAHDAVTAMAVLDDGSNRVVTGGVDGSLSIWSATLEPVATLGGGAGVVALSAVSGNRLAVQREGSFGPEIELWDLPQRSLCWKWGAPVQSCHGSGPSLAVTADGAIVLGTRRGTLLALHGSCLDSFVRNESAEGAVDHEHPDRRGR